MAGVEFPGEGGNAHAASQVGANIAFLLFVEPSGSAEGLAFRFGALKTGLGAFD